MQERQAGKRNRGQKIGASRTPDGAEFPAKAVETRLYGRNREAPNRKTSGETQSVVAQVDLCQSHRDDNSDVALIKLKTSS